MKFIKRHMFILLCGLGAVLGLGLGGFGMTRGSDVVSQLEDGKRLAQQMDLVLRAPDPASVQAIDQLDAQIQKLQGALGRFIEEAKRVNGRDPLVNDLFPKPADDALKYAFQDAYKKEFERFLTALHAGVPPERTELKNWKAMIEEEVRAHHSGEIPRGMLDVPQDVLDRIPDEVRWDHEARAAIWNARHMYCYAEVSSFDQVSPIYQPRDNSPPAMDQLWLAQTGLWVQQDIVAALVEMNEARSAELTDRGEGPWVGNLPIKQIVGIKVTDALFEPKTPPPLPEHKPLVGLSEGRGSRVSVDIGKPPDDVTAVLTQRGSNNEFDVLHARMVLVMDPRYVPQLLDSVLKRNLFTILNVRYRYIPISTEFTGLIYGPDPVIEMEVDLAYHMLADIYYAMLPEELKANAE